MILYWHNNTAVLPSITVQAVSHDVIIVSCRPVIPQQFEVAHQSLHAHYVVLPLQV